MDANGLLSVLAILVAGYTLLSEGKRLDISLRISWIDWALIGALTLTILVIIYSPVILTLKLVEPIKWRWGFNEQITIFSCLIAVLIFIALKLFSGTIPSANFSKWADISERLLREKKLSELGYLLNKHHMQLFSILNHEPWYVRIHNYLSPMRQIFMTALDQNFSPRFYVIRTFLSRLFPSEGSRQVTTAQSISRILKSKLFVLYLAETYPLVAARATLLRFRDSDEFITTFFVALISHPNSSLYRELRDNQNCSHTGEYYLDESNALINFYLKDVSVAQTVSLWKPVGDFVIQFIKENKGSENFYNQPNDYFSEGEARWSCPIFICTLLFEVMISASIFQRINYHMWLMYVDSFVKEILDSLDHHASVNKDREFPSRYDYLLYNIFSACDSWVGTVEHLDYTDNSLESRENFPEFWAAKTLGSMLHKILVSEKLSDDQKIYYLEIAVRRMQLLDQLELRDYSKLIFDNCVRKYEGDKVDVRCIKVLKMLYPKVDHVVRSKSSSLETELAKIG
ncbi:hypothetical protein [Pseudomonas rhodesiae]|uniref:hypothetical protein n=1 Tax=Pseudomonas rhodesiae TaxID=76760 RepID=UPI001F2D4560|nr:hypothetical protein [Pseudomonas rhodesiae]